MMKKILILSLLLLPLLPGCKKPDDPKPVEDTKVTLTLADASATPETKALYANLWALREKGWMFGHHDDLTYGRNWQYVDGGSDTKDVCGDYPAVYGVDLSKFMDDRVETATEENAVRLRCMKQAYNRGMVILACMHLNNPLTGGTAWDVSDSTVVRQILQNDSAKALFATWMARVGDFLKTLKTEDGVPVPVIFRPWHENNGSWFWWGQKLCSDEEFHGLWNTLQDYLTGEGLDNLLWSYSPNLDGGWTQERFLARYPGNDRVSLIGEDAYQWGTEEEFVTALDKDLTFLSGFAKENGKLIAMTECGDKNIPDSTWSTRVLKPVMDKYPSCYFHTWRNYSKEYFAPDPDQVSAADFKKLYEAENTLFLKDIQ